MPGWRLLCDLDSCEERLLRRLAELGWDCSPGNARGFEEWVDPRILEQAAGEGRVVYTGNRVDFARLHAAWLGGDRSHSGIVVRFPQKASAERQLAVLLSLREIYGEDISNQLLWANAERIL